MIRRSGRQKASNAKASSSSATSDALPGSVVEHDTTVTDDDEALTSAGDDDDEFEPGKNKKSTGTKRKRAERKSATQVQGQPSTKKRRRTRGSLKAILEMNVDIVYEIFGHLDPLDLLHLAWASKTTREFLMSKSSRPVWQAARANIPGLPECPDDLSEPQYANLVFGKSCHTCSRHVRVVKFVWTARARLCTTCIIERFSQKLDPLMYDIPFMTWMAMETYLPKIHRTGYSDWSLDRVTAKKWTEAYGAAENKEEWVRAELEKQRKIHAHSAKCTVWYKEYTDRLERENKAAFMNRVKDLERRIGEMGWAEEIEDMKSSGQSITDIKPSILKFCEKEFTEREFQSLLPSLEAFMQRNKERRMRREVSKITNTRLTLLNDIIKTYASTLPPDAVSLGVCTIYFHPEVKELMCYPPDKGDPALLDPIRTRIPDIVQELQEGMEEQLAGMVQSACGEWASGLEPRGVFNLATTAFRCDLCNTCGGSDILRYPRVLVHRCARYYDFPEDTDEPAETRTPGPLPAKATWNRSNPIRFDMEAHQILSEVVVRCGLDPATTSVARMDEADPIFECRACNDPHSGKFMMRWDAVPTHLREEHEVGTLQEFTLRLLQEDEAQPVRIRMDEDVARKRAKHDYTDVVCRRCSETGNTVTIRRHIHTTHQVPNPSEDAGDFAVRVDARTILNTCYSWPPHDEFEDSTAPESTEPTHANTN